MPGIIMIREEDWQGTRGHGGLGGDEIPSGIKPNQIQLENVCAPHLWFCLKVFWEINKRVNARHARISASKDFSWHLPNDLISQVSCIHYAGHHFVYIILCLSLV